MRIFLFITKSEQGGAQTHVVQLSEFFVARGDTVAIMSAPGGWLETEVVRCGAVFLANPYLQNTTNPLRLWNAHKTFLHAINQFHPDIVACHSTIAGLIGRLSLRKKIPTVFTAHGWGFTQGTPFLRRLTLPFLERLAGMFTDKIICVSQNDLRLAEQKHIISTQKLALIHNGVAVPDSRPDPFSQKNNNNPVRIIFVGRLAAPKEPLRLLEVFRNLPVNMQQMCSLNIVGNGPQHELLKRFIDENNLKNTVRLLGDIPHAQVVSYLQSADIFILPTRWEGFPYTILEAMACGLPVIATDVGGISEAIQKTGILIPKENTQALTNALTCLIQNSVERKRLGEAGFKRVQEQFSLDGMCQKTLQVYESILKSR